MSKVMNVFLATIMFGLLILIFYSFWQPRGGEVVRTCSNDVRDNEFMATMVPINGGDNMIPKQCENSDRTGECIHLNASYRQAWYSSNCGWIMANWWSYLILIGGICFISVGYIQFIIMLINQKEVQR